MARFLKRKVDTSSELIDLDTLPSDPYDRKLIESYNVNQKDAIRRAYILRGPYQLRGIEFPQTKFQGDELRKFKEEWYDKHEYKGWLEYSSKSDRVFCLCFYLFRSHFGDGRDTFVCGGYNNWKKVHASLKKHVGLVNSLHNKCFRMSVDLVNENQVVHTQWDNRTPKEKREYRLRLSASTLLGKRLLNDGFAFRGHDESKDSLNKGNFLELLELMGEMNEELANVILENAPANNQMTSPKIQADIKHCYAQEMNHVMYQKKEQMAVKKLDDEYVNPRWPRRKTNITNRHYFVYDCFNEVLDLQIQEFGNCFNEVTSELLVCMSCLSPCDNFSAFDIPNILKLAEKYPYDFNEEEKRRLPVQLGNYFNFVKKDKQFANLDGWGIFFPTDFVILDMEEDTEIPFILGRPFLATARAMVDMSDGRLTLRVGDKEIKFEVGRRVEDDPVNYIKAIESSLDSDI
ncbi:uncharacterized protein LOC110924533 [Helianthus annuus]|uniref:uncharacterized protein LOC110924533 n=1 Tax=Helianthus annuus TaxID=4232 RepID=UPI0016530B5E|nr:uncharacterized protein LOC110924533 [Helianthus annuus]